MTYHASVVLRTLNMADMPALMALKASANWNQTEEDWARLIRMESSGCFGIETEGVLAASTTVYTYGDDLAWIGMVLTLPEFRGRGLARRLMERAIDYAGSRPMRLDASDMGQPLYESLGFVVECPIERWRRDPAPAAEAPAVEPLHPNLALDREVFGADRSVLLRDLEQYEAASVGSAYAYARPGSNAAFFGPCVVTHSTEADTLLRWFVARHTHEPAMLDLFPHHAETAGIAASLGFRPFRRLMRMVRKPVAPSLPDPQTCAIAGFEWG